MYFHVLIKYKMTQFWNPFFYLFFFLNVYPLNTNIKFIDGFIIMISPFIICRHQVQYGPGVQVTRQKTL